MKRLPFKQAAIYAINEVGNPTILATFTVIAAILPMAFVSGMMGPYMSPMPIGASIAMILVVVCSLNGYTLFGLSFITRKRRARTQSRTRFRNVVGFIKYTTNLNVHFWKVLQNEDSC